MRYTQCPSVRRAARCGRRGQTGVALFVVLVLTGAVAVVAVLNLMRGPAALDLAREQATQAALARAKQALIDYAVAKFDEDPLNFRTELGENPSAGVPSFPGLLPCPDSEPPPAANLPPNDREGLADVLECGSAYVSVLGRLPWRSLGSEPFRDGYGECLWYMVSGRHKGGPQIANIMFNWDSQGQLVVFDRNGVTQLAGGPQRPPAAAAIIAPGPPLETDPRQDRTPTRPDMVCPGNSISTNYLEGALDKNNAIAAATPDLLSQLINSYVDPVSKNMLVNDRIAFITPDEIFREIEQRKAIVGTRAEPGVLRQFTRRVAECVAQFTRQQSPSGDRRIAFAGRLDLPASGFQYRNQAEYVDYAAGNAQRLRGRVPFTVGNTHYVLSGRITNQLMAGCGHWTTSGFEHWYRNWKDHLFLAVAPDFDPENTNSGNTRCAGACLTVGTTTNVAAVVFFAGYRRTTPVQTRAAAADRNRIQNYLEGINVERFQDPNSGDNFITADTSGALTNDIAYCLVLPNPESPQLADILSVVPC